MNKLIRFYNQNRKSIFKFIGFIACVILLIQVLNYFTKINNQGSNVTSNTNTISSSSNIMTTNTTSKINNSSAITGEIIGSSKSKEIEAIEQFISYCNDADLVNAYKMLSTDCREEIYQKGNYFQENYYNKIFSTPKTYSIQNWNSSTYLVELAEDVMATGVSRDGKKVQDYITVVNDDGENKLNINSYIGKTEINKEDTKNNITINVLRKHTYMDYETYDIEVKNTSGNIILLDTKKSTKTIYLQDTNGVKYQSYNNEILANNLIVDNNRTNKLTIKFANAYSSTRRINKMVFSNIVPNYNEFKSLDDKSKYDKMETIVINI